MTRKFLLMSAFLVVGCSSGQSIVDIPETPEAEGVETSSTSLQEARDEDPRAVLSLDEALAVQFVAGFHQWADGEFDELVARRIDACIKQDDFIYECMAVQGFAYFPRPATQTMWIPTYSIPPEGVDWVDRYGLGISTTLFPQVILGDFAVGYVGDPPPQPVGLSETSEESRYLKSLAHEEFEQYSITLSGLTPGSHSTATAPDSGATEAISNSCQGQAHKKYPIPEAVEVTDHILELAQRVQSSREWGQFNKQGWDCVRKSGYDIHSIDEARTLIITRHEESGAEAGFGELPRTLDPVPADLAQSLARTQEFEREIAGNAWECGVHPIQAQKFFSDLTTNIILE